MPLPLAAGRGRPRPAPRGCEDSEEEQGQLPPAVAGPQPRDELLQLRRLILGGRQGLQAQFSRAGTWGSAPAPGRGSEGPSCRTAFAHTVASASAEGPAHGRSRGMAGPWAPLSPFAPSSALQLCGRLAGGYGAVSGSLAMGQELSECWAKDAGVRGHALGRLLPPPAPSLDLPLAVSRLQPPPQRPASLLRCGELSDGGIRGRVSAVPHGP